jgi:hypothetical protein
MFLTQADHPGRWWTMRPDGRLECQLCLRFCKLHEGQRGFCFVRQRVGDAMVLTTYGRSSGFCVDPIEKKPLNHFLPGTSVLSFGTAGYITEEARAEFYRHMDAANVDLKAFTEEFYHRHCFAQLQPVLETLVYLRRETNVWLEVTTLLIPGENDSETELHRAADWYALGQWNMDGNRCASCGYEIAGRFEKRPGTWGARRLPVRLAR